MSDEERQRLRSRIGAFIDRHAGGSRDEDARRALLAEVVRFQRARVEPYRKVADASREAGALPPALPTDVFRFVRVAAHAPDQDQRVFRTSGTTSGQRGEHFFRDLTLYDRAARAAARHALFPADERMQLVILAPRPEEAPDSSLSYMLGRFAEWFGLRVDWVSSHGQLDVDSLRAALDAARGPVALLGTSFAFVFAEDAFGDARYALPSGSRVMQTGGFKGKSREVAPEVLRAALASRYGVPESHIVAEYGMTELSSQMYETTLRDALLGGRPDLDQPASRRLWVPGWVGASAVDPVTLAPVPSGERGILRIEDLANLDSACVIQTADLAVMHGAEVELLGRAPGATPRGCSLAVEEALS